MEDAARMSPWTGHEIPTEAAIRHALEAEGLRYEQWSSGPLDVYFAHSHPYNKTIYVVDGAITFVLPTNGAQFAMKVGDRLDLPTGTMHEAIVSTLGVKCFEAHY